MKFGLAAVGVVLHVDGVVHTILLANRFFRRVGRHPSFPVLFPLVGTTLARAVGLSSKAYSRLRSLICRLTASGAKTKLAGIGG